MILVLDMIGTVDLSMWKWFSGDLKIVLLRIGSIVWVWWGGVGVAWVRGGWVGQVSGLGKLGIGVVCGFRE